VATVERPLGSTGVHTHFRGFLAWAQRRNLPVHLVTPFDARFAVYPVFGVGRLAKPFSRPFWVAWYRSSHWMMVRRALDRRLGDFSGPATVYAQDPLSAHAALALKRRGSELRVVLVVHFLRSQGDELAANGYIVRGGRLYHRIQALEQSVLANADAIVAPSSWALRQLEERLPIGIRAERIPNFVHRPERPSSTGKRDLITIGRLEPVKNVDFVLRVLAEAQARGRRYTLTIVGEGPLAARLRRDSARLGIESQVEFTGYVPQAASLLGNHKVYVHSALLENCPLVVLEALAAGMPVVTSPSGGVPELMTHGVEGFFWDVRDVGGAAEWLISVLEAPVKRARLGEAARASYESHYAADVQCPRLMRVLAGE